MSVFKKPGEPLPSVELQEGTPANKVNIKDLFKGKKGILFGVPGAFTPTCSKVSPLQRPPLHGAAKKSAVTSQRPTESPPWIYCRLRQAEGCRCGCDCLRLRERCLRDGRVGKGTWRRRKGKHCTGRGRAIRPA